MEGVPPYSMDDDVNQLDVDRLMPELLLSPLEEVPVNQSSILWNDQGGQNMLVDNNDSTRQTTQFPPQNHQVSGDHDLFNSNCYDSTFFEPTSSSRSPLEEVLVNQSSILWNDQGGQNMLVDNNDSTRQTTQFPPQNHQVSGDHDLFNSNCYDSTFFEPTSSSRSPQFPPHNLQVSGDHNQGQNENHSSGPDSSLQSQNKGLNTQQVRTLTE